MSAPTQFLRQYQLDDQHIYLLELIPLIKMIWADGLNQASEVAILKRFATAHLATLASRNEGVLPITVEATNEFIARFTLQEPSQTMLDDLSQLCANRLRDHSDIEYSKQRADEIIDFCIDIAAACASEYPYEFDERVVANEKATLKSLIASFSLA